jgi:hypothetical protein
MNGLGFSDPAHLGFDTIAVTTPSPPRDKAFSSITTSSAYITWSPPLSDGNSPITGYQVALSYLLGCVAALVFYSLPPLPLFQLIVDRTSNMCGVRRGSVKDDFFYVSTTYYQAISTLSLSRCFSRGGAGIDP